jgi:acyl-CoA thioester hydrolase
VTGAHAHELVVGAGAVDRHGHANNVEFVRWMNDAALAHAAARGWAAAADAAGSAWVARAHRIDYLRPAFAGDRVRVLTWVADVRGATALRRYRIERAGDDAVLAEAETDFAFVDARTGRPRRIPADLKAAFAVPQHPA